MNADQLDQAIQRLPKVELHIHLEGATDAETVWTMAERNGMSLPADSLDSWKRKYEFRDFKHFIEVYSAATRVMRTPEDWNFMVDRFMRNQSRQNVLYSEVFISASHQVDMLPADEWIGAIAEGAASGEQKYGTQVRFITDVARHLPDTQEAVLECALQATESGYFIGLGLGGIEEGFPARLFANTFREARRQGLHVVAHAGETTGAQTIWDAIQILEIERIGHGIRCLDDTELISFLRESGLPLEVCPTSNYCLALVEPDQPHPLRRMVDSGLFCTVNTDDPPMFGTTLVDELRLLARQGFTWDELQQLNLNAVEASFLSSDAKSKLRDQIVATAGCTDGLERPDL